LFEHFVAPGAQTPEHAPETQAWFEHAVPSRQLPDASQLCGVCPLHWLVPVVH
jgi:hypothetical protein